MSGDNSKEHRGVSKIKLALGAASLFLFIVGVKRSYRVEGEPAAGRIEQPPSTEADRP